MLGDHHIHAIADIGIARMAWIVDPFKNCPGDHAARIGRPASIALALGVHPKVVQEALGHSTIAVTLDLYSHVVPSLQREAAREMGAALFG